MSPAATAPPSPVEREVGRLRALQRDGRHDEALSAAGALLRGRLPRALVASAVLVALNRSFYRLLARRQGPAGAVAGVGLHTLHLIVGALSVPVGIVEYLRRPAG